MKHIGTILTAFGILGLANSVWATQIVGYTNMEPASGGGVQHIYGANPNGTAGAAGFGNWGSYGNYAGQTSSGKVWSTGNSSGNNDAFGNWDGSNTFPNVPIVSSGFGEWPASPNSSTLLADFRLNGVAFHPVSGLDVFTDQNFGTVAATSYATHIPSSTPGLNMRFYVAGGINLGAVLRASGGTYYPFSGTLNGTTRSTDIQIHWDWFQGGKHDGAYGDDITVTPTPGGTVGAAAINLNGIGNVFNLAIGNTAAGALNASILTGVGQLYNDPDGAFTITNYLGESYASGTGAEILPIGYGSTLANAIVVHQVLNGIHSATLDLYLNDPAHVVYTLTITGVPEPGALALLGGAALAGLRRRQRHCR